MDFECPAGDAADYYRALYRARGDEVPPHRPFFTGDVFRNVEVPKRGGGTKRSSVAILQHPCTMRTNGIDLADELLVGKVDRHRPLSADEWATGFGKLMPLPDLIAGSTANSRHQAIFFDDLLFVSPDQLIERIACLNPGGVNLLLQRWVHHLSRVVVESFRFNEQTSGVYEEADLIEDWCDEVVEQLSVSAKDATRACVEWLRLPHLGRTRQEMLSDPQQQGPIRREVRTEARAVTARHIGLTVDDPASADTAAQAVETPASAARGVAAAEPEDRAEALGTKPNEDSIDRSV